MLNNQLYTFFVFTFLIFWHFCLSYFVMWKSEVIWKVTYFTAKWRNQAEWYDFWRSILCLSKPSYFIVFHFISFDIYRWISDKVFYACRRRHISCSIEEATWKRINRSISTVINQDVQIKYGIRFLNKLLFKLYKVLNLRTFCIVCSIGLLMLIVKLNNWCDLA